MANEMRVIPLVLAEGETINNVSLDIGNVHIEIRNGMVLYNKAATRIEVNEVVLLDAPKRKRTPKSSVEPVAATGAKKKA